MLCIFRTKYPLLNLCDCKNFCILLSLDLFVVFLYDKVFLTFYNVGELLSIVIVSGGLNKVYEALGKLKIKNFDINVFEKLLTKKGVNNLSK